MSEEAPSVAQTTHPATKLAAIVLGLGLLACIVWKLNVLVEIHSPPTPEPPSEMELIREDARREAERSIARSRAYQQMKEAAERAFTAHALVGTGKVDRAEEARLKAEALANIRALDCTDSQRDEIQRGFEATWNRGN